MLRVMPGGKEVVPLEKSASGMHCVWDSVLIL